MILNTKKNNEFIIYILKTINLYLRHEKPTKNSKKRFALIHIKIILYYLKNRKWPNKKQEEKMFSKILKRYPYL
jgi:hypothetical protein